MSRFHAGLRQRLLISDETKPRFAEHVHLSFNELRQAWVVLGPEHIYWPDETSVSILQKCTGSDTVSAIVASLAEEYEAPASEIAPDVQEFIQTWADNQLIVEAL